MKLYELTHQHRAIVAALSDGEVTPEVEALLAGLEGDIESKVAGCVGGWRELEAEAAGMEAEADRLAEMVRKRRAGAERLKAYVMLCLDGAGIPDIRTELGRVKVQNASRPAIAWEGDPFSIPKGFRREKLELDGRAAFDAYKAGRLPEGFTVNLSRHIRVY